MIRALFTIAVASFVLTVASFAAAMSLGLTEVFPRHILAFADHHKWDDDEGDFEDRGPEITRKVDWKGGDTLDLSLRADVRYIQDEGPGSITITGPRYAVDRVVIDGGHIGRTGRGWSARKVQIVVRAPNVTDFQVSGSSELSIEGYRQDSLSLRMSGSSEVRAFGEARRLDLAISGSGEADLAQLKTREASVLISGSGEAVVAPTEKADLQISGMGDITLTTRPDKLESDVSGSGEVHIPEAAAAPTPDDKT